ncbi:enoyl-CoA hydratase/isomerase family protein [Patulibacter brassicae]|uniref:Enoyl-CoA hydratase/isomerase family protein n=1 Tax=Patulibacter brassicae TaxID=1705717 RepID=A0ABU4VJN0_9ACTN|nr:enoyl-CoA hydratase/isomerase family protein [Patulibacter brassicae]MDX8152047.1 enoyl-CoA hydratase/isomerase family protein [Patulibacter brassicae]
MSEQPMRLEREGDVAVVTIDSPPLNLFDQAMLDALRGVVDALVAEPPRAVLVRAEGRVVSGGVDVEVFHGRSAEQGAALWRELLDIIHRFERLSCPTVFAAHALTLTAAFEWALGCDLIVAGRGARFGLVETVVGLTPSMGGPQRLAERAGSGRARELVMTAELFDAETLERWNVVNRVWEDDEVDAKARALAASLAAGPTRAHDATKQIVRAWCDGGVGLADEIVPEVSGALFETEDLRAAVAGFLERGPKHGTVYQGR